MLGQPIRSSLGHRTASEELSFRCVMIVLSMCYICVIVGRCVPFAGYKASLCHHTSSEELSSRCEALLLHVCNETTKACWYAFPLASCSLVCPLACAAAMLRRMRPNYAETMCS